MTPEQALQVLTQATGLLNGTRESHLQILKALETIRLALEKKNDQ